jgi:hypothetical protein
VNTKVLDATLRQVACPEPRHQIVAALRLPAVHWNAWQLVDDDQLFIVTQHPRFRPRRKQSLKAHTLKVLLERL